MSAVIPTMNLFSHMMVKSGDLWVSRAPFTKIDWQSNADRLQADHRRFGILTEARAGNEAKYSLNYVSTLATLRDTFGTHRVGKNFGGTDFVCYPDPWTAAFEFYLMQNIGDLSRYPMTDVSPFHAQGMCLAIGADLMTDDQYVKIVSGRSGKRQHATPNGELFGPDGKEYVVSSLKERREGTVDVEDPAFPTDPESGTRHYTGNVWKWLKRSPGWSIRGGSWFDDTPAFFAGSYRGVSIPGFDNDCVGFVASMTAYFN